jgi:glycogen operon protein
VGRGGLYQVGSFAGDAWQEWNGRFRDDVRRFVKSDDDTVLPFAYRCFGSPDLYAHKARGPEQSINFVTSHDGFTLNDLVSYDHKHNEANGESWPRRKRREPELNCGTEGPTTDPDIERLRRRQVKNFLAITLLSLGTPMLLMGDEVRRTQHGNNNAYCQDNEISWFDWTLLETHRGLHRFVKTLVRQRRMLATGERESSLSEILRRADIQPHGVRLNEPDLRTSPTAWR